MIAQYRPDFQCGIKGFVTAFKAKRENGFYFKGEMHDFWEMVYVSEGTVMISEEARVYELQAGSMIFHRPMEFHKISVEKGPHAKIMIISFESADNLFCELGSGVFELSAENKLLINEIYDLLDRNFDLDMFVRRKEESSIVGEKMTFLRFELFLLSLLSEQKDRQARQYTVSAMNYQLIINTMNQNLSKNLSVEELAKLCNLSVGNIKKTFAKYADGGIMKHFNRLKIKQAMRLLKEGRSVAEISDELGFSSQSYFSVVFKRETGILPSEYRQNGEMF